MERKEVLKKIREVYPYIKADQIAILDAKVKRTRTDFLIRVVLKNAEDVRLEKYVNY